MLAMCACLAKPMTNVFLCVPVLQDGSQPLASMSNMQPPIPVKEGVEPPMELTLFNNNYGMEVDSENKAK